MESKQRSIIRDNGQQILVTKIPLTNAYSDEETIRLSGVYDVHSHPGFVPSSLGDAGTESFAGSLFRAYSFLGKFCGFARSELESFADQKHGSWQVNTLQPHYLRPESIGGAEVLFPTEAFLKNQRIKQRFN